jgi:hypothetical protein
VFIAETIESPLDGRDVEPAIRHAGMWYGRIDFVELDGLPEPTGAAELGEKDIPEDGHQPGPKIGAWLPGVKAFDRSKEAFLNKVVGQNVIAGQAARQSAQPGNLGLN